MQLALLGCGRWAMFLYSFLRGIEGVSVAAVYDRDTAAANRFGDICELRAVSSLQEILNNDSIQGVLILTGNSTHYPLAVQCLEAGKDVFVEKPITADFDEAAAMIRLAKQKERILMVGHNSRRHPAVRKMKQLIEEKIAGEIRTVEATFSYDNLEEICGDSWRNCSVACPGGPLIQLGVHHADNLPYLFGPVDKVFGEVMPCPENSNVPAGGRLLLKFKNGIIGSITADYCTAPELFSIYARGDKGEIRVDGEEQLGIIDASGKTTTEIVDGVHSLHSQMAEFCRCMKTRQEPETGGPAGLEALKIILTGLASARQGRPLMIKVD